MSASKQKKVRSDLRADGLDRKSEEELKAEASSRRFRRNAIITVVVVVLVFAAALVVNSNLFYTGTTAITVGGTEYTAAEFNFYFRSAYNAFCNENEQYLSYILDTSAPLDEQVYSGGTDGETTWADFFTEQAKAQMSQVTALYDQAVANGYTISQEGKDGIESSISYYELYAGYQNMTPDGYMAALFGKGMTQDLYRQCMTKYVTATEYGQSVMESYSYSDEQLDARYAEIADDYDVITFHSYFVSNSRDEYSEMDDEAKAAASHDAAEELAASDSFTTFSDKVYELLNEEARESYEPGESTLNTMSGGNIASYYPDCADWLRDPARIEGDSTVVDTGTGSYAVMYVSRNDNQYNLVNVRHILIRAEADENGEYTAEALEAAHKRVEEIEAEWKQNPTEDNFAALAGQYSEDTGSNTNGGLYENVAEGQMVEEFNDFCFGGRQPGDTAIVHGESANYNGYHLIYFVGEGPVYADYIAENVMRNEDFNTYVTEISASYGAEEGFAFRFTNRK